MDDDLNWLNEPLFHFSERLSLQTLVATKLALSLWRDKICNQAKNTNAEKLGDILKSNPWLGLPPGLRVIRKTLSTHRVSDEIVPCFPAIWKCLSCSCLDENKKFSCRDVIVVPTRIADSIDQRIVSIGNELQIWLKKLMDWDPEIVRWKHSPIEKIFEMFSVFFDCVVLEKDCTICLRSTVSGILTSTEIEIAPIAKYRMACDNCLENWIRELWPVVNNNIDVLGQSPLIFYWNNVMMDESEEEYEEYEYEWILSTMTTYENWIAVEYFWNRLSVDKQTTRTIDILRYADFRVMKRFLTKLNEIQVEKVCSVAADHIFRKMIEEEEYFENAVKFWIRKKDFLSENVSRGILSRSWLIVFNPSKSNLDRVKRNNALLLLKVWTTAPGTLKAFVLNRDNFVKLFSQLDDTVRSYDDYYGIEFLISLMANADYELRHSVWRESWRKLVIRFKPSKLEEIMRLCFANDEEIERFKEDVMANFEELESFSSLWIKYEFFTEFSEYLNFCVKNPERLENLSKKIISSNLVSIFSYYDYKFAQFDSFVRSNFRDPHSIPKFMEEMVLAPEFLGVIYRKLDECRFDEVVSIASRFPDCEKRINEMKRAFPEYSRSNLARGQIAGFVGRKFNRFLRWCCLNETAIFEFKKSLIIDTIFEVMVNKLIAERWTSLHWSSTILDFDNFLEWYFGGSKNAKIYKSTRVIHHEEIGTLTFALLKASSKFIDQFLEWAFDDDATKIAKVKSFLIDC